MTVRLVAAGCAGLIAGVFTLGSKPDRDVDRSAATLKLWEDARVPNELELQEAPSLASQVWQFAATLDSIRSTWLDSQRVGGPVDSPGHPLSPLQSTAIDLGPRLTRYYSAMILSGDFRTVDAKDAPIVPMLVSGPSPFYVAPGPHIGGRRIVFAIGERHAEARALIDSIREARALEFER